MSEGQLAGLSSAQPGELEGITYSEWISSRLWVDYGAPFTFEGRPYLKKIHDLQEPKILLRCIGGDMLIRLPDGRSIPMRDLACDEFVGQELLAWSEAKNRLVTSKISRIHLNGKMQCLRLKFDNGMELVCTGDHKLWTQRGTWGTADQVSNCTHTDPKYRRVGVVDAEGAFGWANCIGREDAGEQDVYDFTMTNDYSFVANGIVVHNCGRQVEKSSSLAAKLISSSCVQKNWKCLYVSSSDRQTKVFSHVRLDRVLASPYVRGKYFDPQRCVDDVYEKQMLNGSTIFLSYASTDADRCRGITADMLLCDEIQDMTSDVFPVLEETMSHQPHPHKVYAGTPKTLNNSMETHWKNSTQCEWLIWCACGEWVFQDEKIVRKAGPTCPKCGNIIDPAFGKWVPMGAEDAEFMGFRIPQTMVPWIVQFPNKWKDLYEKSVKWGQKDFYNEVLGLAHEKGANPITETELKACCDQTRGIVHLRNPTKYFDAMYAGVDWGAGLGSFTVLTIGGYHGGKFHVEFVKRFVDEKDEPGVQVEEIAKICQRFGVGLVGCDWGGGYVQNKDLAVKMTGYADVVQFYESGVKKRDMSYQPTSRLYTFNRSMGIAMVITEIKNKGFSLPKWEAFSEFAEDFTCVFEDYNRALRQIVYDHPDSMPDDALHSMMFFILALKIGRGEKAL
jgi:hypothetical protein